MADKTIFAPAGRIARDADATNLAGGDAYALSDQEALASLVCVGFLGDTYYASGKDQLDALLGYAAKCPDDFVAKAAVYGRSAGYMKDAPAALVTHLICRASTPEARATASAAFTKAIDNGRMLRNVVQMIRSGRFGRRSLGTWPKRLVAQKLNGWDPDYLVKQSVGNDPSIADVVNLSRPKPPTEAHAAVYRWLIGKDTGEAAPQIVRDLDAFRRGSTAEVPDVPFQLVDGVVDLTAAQWAALFARGGWHFCRMNINTAARHGLFEDEAFVAMLAAKIRDPEAVRRAKAFPYQLLATYMAIQGGETPRAIADAVHDAMEVAVGNCPPLPGRVVVAVDTSGSMSSPVGHSGNVRYVDVAGLIASAVLRSSPGARVCWFDTSAGWETLEPRDTVMTNARRLARMGGGTDCSAAVELVDRDRVPVDTFVMVSDNESWANPWGYGGSASRHEDRWRLLKVRNPKARRVLIDLGVSGTTQADTRQQDTLRIGGFSDQVFKVMASWLGDRSQSWVSQVEAVDLAAPGR